MFDTATWSEALTVAGPHIRALSFDPTGPRLATGSADGGVSIWEIPSGARARHLREVGDPVNAIAFSPDGQLVAAGTGRGTVQVWRAPTGAFQSEFNAMRGKILTVEFDPTSKLVVAAGDRGEVAVANAVLGMPETVLGGAHGVIAAAHFDPTSRSMVGASGDGTAHVWSAISPYRQWSSSPVADDCGLVTSLEPDGRFLAIGCRDHTTRVWDTAHDRLLAELPSVTDPGRSMVIASGNDGLLWFWELPTGRPLWKLQAHRSRALGIHFEGDALVTHGSTGEVSRWVLPVSERVIGTLQAE